MARANRIDTEAAWRAHGADPLRTAITGYKTFQDAYNASSGDGFSTRESGLVVLGCSDPRKKRIEVARLAGLHPEEVDLIRAVAAGTAPKTKEHIVEKVRRGEIKVNGNTDHPDCKGVAALLPESLGRHPNGRGVRATRQMAREMGVDYLGTTPIETQPGNSVVTYFLGEDLQREGPGFAPDRAEMLPDGFVVDLRLGGVVGHHDGRALTGVKRGRYGDRISPEHPERLVGVTTDRRGAARRMANFLEQVRDGNPAIEVSLIRARARRR